MQEQVTRLLRDLNIPYWSWNMIIIVSSLLLGALIGLILSILIKKKAKYNESSSKFSLFQSLLRRLGPPVNVFLPLFLFNVLLPTMKMPLAIMHKVSKGVEILLIMSFAWILIRCIQVVQEYVLARYDINKADNLRERKIRTQLQFIRRIIVGLIVILTVAAVLLTFSSLRKVGAGLLTGVGLSGIIIGFAAQRSISNLLAGFQIAFTQPIRINDAVIAEGEFGTVEEITLTYVVLKLWDERRLVLPINYFIEKPFQNWTRTSSELLGTVILFTDYNLPVEPIRSELTRLLQKSKYWDGRVNVVHVTDATENTVQIRALMSARNARDIFELRCYVRENLIKFINDNLGESLPKNRMMIGGTEDGLKHVPDSEQS
ncbi:MAG TPA: mechanosensitive ion channel domain-containing protein [Flavitalea sp.]|nr:mechanosensitive ion channel domain-containing protein [Flavitalea sp.]